MLVLARKKNQSIMIGDDIEVVVVDMGHDQVKIGIKAPGHVSVHRREIYESIKNEMEKAALKPGVQLDLGALKKPISPGTKGGPSEPENPVAK